MQQKPIMIAVLFFATACGGSQPVAEDGVQMKEHAVRDIDRERAEAPRKPVAAPEAPEEELAVEMFEVAPGAPGTATNGLRIELLNGGPDWAFRLDHHGRKSDVSYKGSPLYMEGVAFGSLYVIREEGGIVTATLRSDSAAPLDPQTATALARREQAQRLGCDGTSDRTSTNENGTLTLSVFDDSGEKACEVTVGLYTQEVIIP